MSYPVGTPYKSGGRGPDGTDCWGLVLAECPGLPLAHYSAADSPRMLGLVAQQAATGNWRPSWPPMPGDIVLMGSSPRLGHAGVMTAVGVKHAKRGVGVVVEPLALLRQTFPHMESWQWVG